MSTTPIDGTPTTDDLHARIQHDFTNHPPTTDDVSMRLDSVTGEFIALAHTLVALAPPSRELSTALTKLEESSMWTKAAIARHQP